MKKDFMDLTIDALNKTSLEDLKKRPIPDGTYEVKFYDELDRGYGTESAVDEITVEFKDNVLFDGTAFGLHDISEREVEWTVYITDEEQEENIRTQVLIQLDKKESRYKMSQVPYYLLKLSPSELLTLVNALRLASSQNREFKEMMIKLGDIYRNEFILDDVLTSEVPNETED